MSCLLGVNLRKSLKPNTLYFSPTKTPASFLYSILAFDLGLLVVKGEKLDKD